MSREYGHQKPATNPGCGVSSLPFGASCASSCQRVAACKRDFGIKGHEGGCRFTPSRYTPNVPPVDVAPFEAGR